MTGDKEYVLVHLRLAREGLDTLDFKAPFCADQFRPLISEIEELIEEQTHDNKVKRTSY